MAFSEILKSGTVPLAEKVSFVRSLIEGDALRSEWNGKEIVGMTWEEFEGQFKGLEERARAQLLYDVSTAIGRKIPPSPASTGAGGVVSNVAAGAGAAAAAAVSSVRDEGKVDKEPHPHTEPLLKMLASQGLCISDQDHPEDQALTRGYVDQMLQAATQAGLLDLRAFDTNRAYSLAEFTQILSAHPGWSKVFTDPAIIAKLFFIVTDGAKKSPFTLATLALTASWLGDHRPDLTPPFVLGRPETYTTSPRIKDIILIMEGIIEHLLAMQSWPGSGLKISFVSFPSAPSKAEGRTVSLTHLNARDGTSRLTRRNAVFREVRYFVKEKAFFDLFRWDSNYNIVVPVTNEFIKDYFGQNYDRIVHGFIRGYRASFHRRGGQ